MKKKLLKTYLPFLVLALVLSCTSNKKSSVGKTDTNPIPTDKKVVDVSGVHGGHLVLSSAGNPKTFNPLFISDVETSTLLSSVFAALVGLSLDPLQSEMALAKTMSVSKDNLQYTFELREGILWSDGEPFTADDVVFTYQIVSDPKVNAADKDSFKQSDGSLPKLEKLGKYKLRFTLKEINVLFDSAVGSMLIIPKHKWEAAYKAGNIANVMLLNEDPANIPVLGPFVLDQFTTDQRIVLKRNPHYWKFDKSGRRLPYLDKVIRIIVPNHNAMAIKFENGETDMLEVRSDQYDRLKDAESKVGFTIHNLGPAYLTYYFQLNLNTGKNSQGNPYVSEAKQKLYGNKVFRQALSYAMDREGFVKTAFHGRAVPITSFVPPANKVWRNPKPKPYPYDLKRSAKMLDSIGVVDSDGDGLREDMNGAPIRIVIKTNVENQTRVQIGNMIKQDLRKIGIDTALNPVPFNSLTSLMRETRDYDAIILGWGSGVPPDPVMSKNAILSSGRSHHWHPSQKTPATPWEARMDELMVLNQGTLDLKERQKYYWEILDIWEEELPQIMLVSPQFFVGTKNKFGNVKPVALRTYYEWNVEEIYDRTLAP